MPKPKRDNDTDTGELEAYTRNIEKIKSYPQNEYEHADSLVRSELDEEMEVLSNFSKIVDKHLQLVNIGNDTLMRAYQIDGILLTHFASMARREPALERVFGVLYFGWRNELLLTKAMNGAERKHQAQVDSPYTPKENLGGFGQNYPQQEQEDEGNFLSKLFGRKKKKREWQ